MKAKILFAFIFSAVFLLRLSDVIACNYSAITLVGTPVNNGNGTYSFTVRIAIGLTISWGGTTNFSITPSSGSFTTISSFSPAVLTSNYVFCSLCNGVDTFCSGVSTNVTAAADGTLNAAQTILNFTQTTSLPAAGCSPPAACWGNGFPFIADDYQAVCVTSNPDSIAWDITIITNGLPGFIICQGLEDDIGPDVGSSGSGCPESIMLNPTEVISDARFTNEAIILSHDFSGNYFLNFNLYSPSSFTLNIFSADGKNIETHNYASLQNGHHQIPIAAQNLSEGIYFCRIAGENLNRSFKFIK